ncbi:hypothetical protein [Echinicola sp. 20G]|uniref:hypothetical protein n=1 Tax=Echinicola sp. 20G TaxID=2781961 RepID=UPI0019107351|nr:hypothetical protein [Echinicola sp. 20G]
MTFKPKQKIRKVFVHLQCSFLFVRNLVFAKKFSLKKFSYVNNLVVQGNKAEILWIVSGCYKIFIKGFGIIPGNTSGITFTYQTQQNPVEIIFYGIGGHKETKEIRLEAAEIKLIDKFIPTTTTPQLTSIPLAHQKLKCAFANSSQLTELENIIIDIQTPKITPLNLSIRHVPFIKSNYPT